MLLVKLGTSRRKWKAVAIAAVAGILAVVLVMTLRGRGVDLQQIAAWLSSVGDEWWAPVAFIGIYALFTTFLLPATLLTLTAGVVWGWLVGGLWVVAASAFGSAVPYFIARLGAGGVERAMKGKTERIYRALQNEGFMSLLLMRLMPVVPYNLLNYAGGFANLRFRDYFAATFIGTLPGIFIYTYLAASIKHGIVSPRQAFVRILIAGVLLALLALTSRLFAGRVRKRLGTTDL